MVKEFNNIKDHNFLKIKIKIVLDLIKIQNQQGLACTIPQFQLK
jgi:hypothetical protein